MTPIYNPPNETEPIFMDGRTLEGRVRGLEDQTEEIDLACTQLQARMVTLEGIVKQLVKAVALQSDILTPEAESELLDALVSWQGVQERNGQEQLGMMDPDLDRGQTGYVVVPRARRGMEVEG